MDEERIEPENVSNYSKWHGRNKPLDYDRPGRKDKAERKYRRNKTHTGKTSTLRDKRGTH
jgi:hypothetical protein